MKPETERKIFNLDPLSVLDNSSLDTCDHVALAARDLARDLRCLLFDEEKLISKTLPLPAKLEREWQYTVREAEGILSGVGSLELTRGQSKISELLIKALNLLPDKGCDLQEHILMTVLKNCANMGINVEGKPLGFSPSYRYECQKAGIVSQSRMAGRVKPEEHLSH